MIYLRVPPQSAIRRECGPRAKISGRDCFVDYGDNLNLTGHVEHDDDGAAVDAAHRMNARSIGAGFEVWRDGIGNFAYSG